MVAVDRQRGGVDTVGRRHRSHSMDGRVSLAAHGTKYDCLYHEDKGFNRRTSVMFVCPVSTTRCLTMLKKW